MTPSTNETLAVYVGEERVGTLEQPGPTRVIDVIVGLAERRVEQYR